MSKGIIGDRLDEEKPKLGVAAVIFTLAAAGCAVEAFKPDGLLDQIAQHFDSNNPHCSSHHYTDLSGREYESLDCKQT